MSGPQPAGKRRIEFLSFAAVGVILVGLIAMTTVVYARLAEELANRTRESIADRVMAVESAVADLYSLAADEAMNLMLLMEQGGGSSGATLIAEQLGTIQDGLVGCSSAWIVPEGKAPIVARGTSSELVRSRTWWRNYLQGAADFNLRDGEAFANLGIRRNIGYIAPPFRDDSGIGTIVPLAVVRYLGMKRVATVFFELDITTILDDYLTSLPAGSSIVGAYPIELSFYDQDGSLIETTRNIPLVKVLPFHPDSERKEALTAKGSLSDYLMPGDKSIEAQWRDDRIGLVCVGRTPARLVMRDVRKVATYVLIVGAVALGSVLILGLLLIQAFRRARSFEREQFMARFEALQAKVNPHFLFNTLDSMIGVAENRDFDTLMRMLRALSSMLHATVRSTKGIVTVGEELAYVRAYLAIQEVRYRDRFRWKIEAEDSVIPALVCRFSVQPLVENCFTHGVHEGREGMNIEILARGVEAAVEIEVRDDGPGCDIETWRKLEESFESGRNLLGREGGLFNAHDRSRMAFGDGYGLDLVERENGFCVRLKVPAVDKEGQWREE
jgi:hypothetical protein